MKTKVNIEHWEKDTFQKMKHITIIANPFQGNYFNNIICGIDIVRILFAYMHISGPSIWGRVERAQ